MVTLDNYLDIIVSLLNIYNRFLSDHYLIVSLVPTNYLFKQQLIGFVP